MTRIVFIDTLQKFSNELKGKCDFDTVHQEKKKPESENSGFGFRNNSAINSDMIDDGTSILSGLPNSHKENGTPMSERFIKFIPSQNSSELRSNYPFAFLLLNLIAERARRETSIVCNLNIGEAYVGDHKSIGASRQQYRTALKVLVCKKFIEILATCRNRKKSTTDSTTKGTKVRLLRSDIWDINIEDVNHITNHRATTDQPRTRKNKNEKEYKDTLLPETADALLKEKKNISISKKRKKTEPSPLIERDTGIFITEVEHQKLILSKGNEEILKTIYSEMSVWKDRQGIQGGDDYRTALKWNLRTSNTTTSNVSKNKTSKYNNPSFKSKNDEPVQYVNKISFRNEEQK
jgi:hypothetical protein